MTSNWQSPIDRPFQATEIHNPHLLVYEAQYAQTIGVNLYALRRFK